VPSHGLEDSIRTLVDGTWGDGTGTAAALMVRARPAVGWEEGKRMRVVLAPRCSGGRRYGR
jgi:hypothetical protein